MIENARMIERRLRQSLIGVRGIAGVHGKGCLLGVEFEGPSSQIHARLLERRIITGTSSDPKVLRLLPPLCTTTEQIDLFIDCLNEDAAAVTS